MRCVRSSSDPIRRGARAATSARRRRRAASGYGQASLRGSRCSELVQRLCCSGRRCPTVRAWRVGSLPWGDASPDKPGYLVSEFLASFCSWSRSRDARAQTQMRCALVGLLGQMLVVCLSAPMTPRIGPSATRAWRRSGSMVSSSLMIAHPSWPPRKVFTGAS